MEYQWGVAKGRLAQGESERSALQEEIDVLSALASHLKGALVGGKGGKAGKLTLGREEQAVFDRLLAPP